MKIGINYIFPDLKWSKKLASPDGGEPFEILEHLDRLHDVPGPGPGGHVGRTCWMGHLLLPNQANKAMQTQDNRKGNFST